MIHKPKGIHGLLIATLGHEELGALREEKEEQEAEKTGQGGDGHKDLPGSH